MTNEANTVRIGRGLVAAIRHNLDMAGRTDIALRREWIADNVPGELLLLNIPVGPDLVVPLKLIGGSSDLSGDGRLQWTADQFAKALINLSAGAATLRKYVAAVRKEALVQIDKAQRAGLDLGIERVGLKSTYASYLACNDWKDATSHVLAAVTIRCTSFHLQPETIDIFVEAPADVAKELADTIEEQRERQERILELEDLGGDLIVDAITLDLLRAHGIDAPDVLQRVWREQRVTFVVHHGGEEIQLSLRSSDGDVTASINLPEARWNGEHLWFWNKDRDGDHRSLVGRTLSGLVAHPVFAARPIVEVLHQDVDQIVFELSDKYIFDAASRALRPLERRLAA